MFVKLGSFPLVLKLAVSTNEPTHLINSAAKFVTEVSLFVSLHVHKLLASLGVTVKVTSDIMAIKVEALKVEWWRELALFIKFTCLENLSSLFTLDNVSSLRIHKVTLLIDSTSNLINELTFLVLQDQRMSPLISVEISQDVVHIELPLLSITNVVHAFAFIVITIRFTLCVCISL